MNPAAAPHVPAPIHVWVTKHALTEGIREYDAQETHTPRMVAVAYTDDQGHRVFDQYLNTPDWHLTREAAIAQVEKMRLAEIERLEAKIAKLRALT